MHDPQNDDDDDGAWVPLQPRAQGNENAAVPNVSTSIPRSSSTSSSRRNTRPRSTSTTSATASTTANTAGSNDTLLQIQRRLETQISIKQNFIEQPIDLFWKRYLINLARELWELEMHIRLGLSMIIAGLILRLFLLSTWFYWYPKVVLFATILLGSVVFLDFFGIQNEIKRFWSIITSPDQVPHAIEQLDMRQLRRLSLFLILIPTFLEMRTLSFLTQTMADSGSSSYTFLLASCLLSVMLYFLKEKRRKPRECIYKGMLALYGCAFIYCLLRTDLRRAPLLGAPFLSASGTLLLTHNDDDMEWIARVLRHALRLTLRDVLSSMGQKVSEDQMLQLAVLRWIADFWASSPEASPATNTTNDTRPPETTPEATSSTTGIESTPASETPSTTVTIVPSTDASSVSAEVVSAPSPVEPPTSGRRSSRTERFRTREVQWSELLPMLDVATEHMSAESHMLHHHSPSAGSNPNPPRFQTAHRQPEHARCQDNSDDPFAGLRDMLMSLNVDEHGKQAVLAYRRAVESFPPDRQTALILSVVRKAPAFLTVILHLLCFGGRSTILTIILLLPFVVMEYCRIRAWESRCQQMASVYNSHANDAPNDEDDSVVSSKIWEADPMLILLCGDECSFVRPPTLLLVWHNIQGSVSALEVGLTAARCAQTGIVAAEFAGNVMSLMQFGIEVHEHGWFHGAAVVAKELLLMHAHVQGDGTKYARAAIGAVENAKVVGRNVQNLAEEDNLDPIMRQVVGTLRAMTGHGWLWGKEKTNTDEGDQNLHQSCNSVSTPSLPSARTVSSVDHETSKSNNEQPVAEEPVQVENADTHLAVQEGRNSDDLAEVMGMIASAFEQGLIDENEKNNFCEKLSRLSKDEIQNAPIIKGMKQSLLIVLDSNDDHRDWQAADVNSVKNRAKEKLKPETVGFDSKLKPEIADSDEAFKPVENCSEKEPQPEAIDRSTQVTSHQLPPVNDVGINESTANGCAASAGTERAPSEKDSEASGDVVATSDTTSEDLAPTGDERTECRQQSGQSQQEEGANDGENRMMNFGIAALGVVAGGLLLGLAGNTQEGNRNQNRTNREGNNEHDRQETSASSTVVIEELSDDDGEDGWVSIPQ